MSSCGCGRRYGSRSAGRKARREIESAITPEDPTVDLAEDPAVDLAGHRSCRSGQSGAPVVVGRSGALTS
jgi:hypothetical protein